jgi:hypothetical protein
MNYQLSIMKKDTVSEFLLRHKQIIPDDAFVRTLFNKLDYYPQPAQELRPHFNLAALLPLLAVIVASVVIAAFGVWQPLLETGSIVFYGINLAHTAICITAAGLLTIVSLFACRERILV